MIPTYEGFKNKRNIENELSERLSKFVSGMYIIFEYESFNWKVRKKSIILLLGRIGKTGIHEERNWKSGDVEYSAKVQIDIIDTIYEYDNDAQILIKGTTCSFTINSKVNAEIKNIIVISPSLNSTQIKFNELKNELPYKDWKINSDMEKYNL